MDAQLSFKSYLSMVVEDVQQDIAKITSDIAMIDTQINQRTQPLLTRKAALQKMLALKQKQAQADATKDGAPQPGQTQNPMQASNQTKTPGAAQTQTPGNAPQLPQ